MQYHLPRQALNQIENLARQGFPHEICGFLGGSQFGYASEVRPARNVAASRKVEYNIAPEETLATLLEFEQRGLKITAVYHSHPRYPAQPSSVDLALADMPDVFYLITSVTDGASGQLNCETRVWQLKNGKAFSAELVILD